MMLGARGESSMEEEDDDAEYYRQEVGQDPDPGICVYDYVVLANLQIVCICNIMHALLKNTVV